MESITEGIYRSIHRKIYKVLIEFSQGHDIHKGTEITKMNSLEKNEQEMISSRFAF